MSPLISNYAPIQSNLNELLQKNTKHDVVATDLSSSFYKESAFVVVGIAFLRRHSLIETFLTAATTHSSNCHVGVRCSNQSP